MSDENLDRSSSAAGETGEKASYTGKPKRSPGRIILRIVLIFLAVIILLAVLDKLFVATDNADSKNTYGTDDDGLKAIYLSAEIYLAEHSGVKVERHTKIARFLPEKSIAICTADNYSEFSPSEIDNIQRYVKSGGIFIFITTNEFMWQAAYSFAESFGIIDTEESGTEPGETAVEPGEAALSAVIRKTSGTAMFPSVAEIGGDLGLEIDETLGLGLKYGEGMVYFNNRVNELRNEPMKSSKSFGAKLLVALERMCNEKNIKKVVFDEYYSGVQSNPVPDILGYGFVLCVLELAIATVVYFISAGQRFGAPEKAGVEEKRDETEHIAATAKLYKRTGSGSIGFKIHMEALMEDVAVLLGLPAGTPLSETADAAIASGQFNSCGLEELVGLYNNAGSIRFTDKELESYIRKIDKIRKERLQ
ncbi:MAG: hypothetical protein J5950_04905 [Clostridia bacterium]|nr:hypothetical protein [Clostridia bacterium]